MNKLELINTLASKQDLSKADAKLYVDLFFEIMSDALSRGERIVIRGLCSFKIKEYKPYTGHNPKTGNVMTFKPKKLPVFKPGTELKERVNR